MDNKKIRVAMVDDHTIFRQGISKLLAGVPGIVLIMDVGSGEELIKELHADPRKIPDVLLRILRCLA